jgi:hypothetical protein
MVWVEAPVSLTSDTSPKLTSLVVPVVLKSVPFLVATEPVMSRLPPKEDRPVPTLKLLLPVTLVAPLSDTAPVPVEKVTAPVWEMLPPAKVEVPVPTLKVLVPVTLVAPLSETAPVPVPKLLAPVWEKLLLKVVAPVRLIPEPPLMVVKLPALVEPRTIVWAAEELVPIWIP